MPPSGSNGTTIWKSLPKGSGSARRRWRAHRAEGVDRVPRLRVFWDRWQYPLEGWALRQQVLDGEPRIMLDDNSATENSIAIDPFQLQPGEAAQVGDAVAAALREASRHAPAPARPPETEIAGNWELHVDFLQGSRVHRLDLEQSGPELAGRQRSTQFEGPVSGWLNGDQIQLSFTSRYEAARSAISSTAKSATAG